MTKDDYHFEPSQEYPWRIDLCLKNDGKVNFSGASADLTIEDAISQGKILLTRFMAKQAILTPIIVDKRLTQEIINKETKRLTTILES